MRGSPWTEKRANLTGSLAAAGGLGAFLAAGAVGALAGLASAHVRLHLGLPGHKALLLIAPVVLARLVFRSPVGACGGMVAAALASMAVGGWTPGPAALAAGAPATHLAGAALAGAVLDVALGRAERRRLAAGWTILVAGLAGLIANLAFLFERVLTPFFQSHAFLGVPGLEGRALSYAFFGLLAGVLGAVPWAIGRRVAQG
jgi:hypothetical protein